LMRNTIMTERLVRRGVQVGGEAPGWGAS
jgi:hypothetical protein